MRLVVNWLIAAAAVFITAYILPGVMVDGYMTALIVAVVLGAISMVLKPLLVILTLPITLLTLGLFYFVLNALLVMLAAWAVSGFEVENFWWALAFSLVLSIVQSVLNRFGKEGALAPHQEYL